MATLDARGIFQGLILGLLAGAIILMIASLTFGTPTAALWWCMLAVSLLILLLASRQRK